MLLNISPLLILYVAITYKDKWLRFIGYPLLGFVIRHFGEIESIGTLMKQPLYYGDLLWNTLLVACSWEANRRLILNLDAKYSWINDQFQRFIIQAFGSLIITVLIVASMIYIWNELIIHRPGNFNTGFLLVYDFPLTIVFTLLVPMVWFTTIFTCLNLNFFVKKKLEPTVKLIAG